MFIKRDRRRIEEILIDPEDDNRSVLKLSKCSVEFKEKFILTFNFTSCFLINLKCVAVPDKTNKLD